MCHFDTPPFCFTLADTTSVNTGKAPKNQRKNESM